MNILELLITAIGLSMDAFAVAVCTGLTLPAATIRKSLIVGLYFGIFQAGMPLAGYLLGTQFADKIITFDHWIAFVLLLIIGGKMIIESFSKKESDGSGIDVEFAPTNEVVLTPAKMLPLALATSIDALAVGVSFAFLKVNITQAVLSIGVITLVLSMAGVKIGNAFGLKFKSKAELTGGVILVLMGLKILLEHLGVIHL